MLISKEEFVKYITAIKNLWDYQNESVDLIHKYNPYSQISIIDYPSCEDELLELLKIVTNDGDYISIFCYDLNFGKDWEPGYLFDDNGDEIELATIDDLWEVLNRNG